MDHSAPSIQRTDLGAGGGPLRRAGSYTSTFQVISGPTLVDGLGAELDDLVAAAGTPVTARGTWLRAWVRAYKPAEPWGVTVRERFSGRLDGVALFSTLPDDDHDRIAPLGRRQQDRGALPVRGREAADALAAGVAGCLRSRPRPWALRLGQLPVGDPVAARLGEQLEGARLIPGLPIPKVEFGTETTLETWLGKGLRKQLRKARNRMEEDGAEATITFDRDPGAVGAILDEVEHTHRAREQDALRTSDLDSQRGLRFWRSVILAHAACGEIEVATLHFGQELAAYVVSLLDDDSYRVFDGRCATSWGRFSPGRQLETATLERAFGDPCFARVDWMNGCASEKLLAANDADDTEHLVASSPGLTVDLDVIGRAPAAVDDSTVLTLASGAR